MGHLFESHQALKVANVYAINELLEDSQVTNVLEGSNFQFPPDMPGVYSKQQIVYKTLNKLFISSKATLYFTLSVYP